MRRKRVLFIGQFPPPEGGVTILVKCLFDELRLRSEITLDYIDIAQPRLRIEKVLWPIFFDNILALLLFFSYLLIKIKKNDIITLHVSTDKLVYYGLITVIVSKLFSKKVIIRKFGGTDYNSYGYTKKSLTKFTLKKCNAYLCETKQLVHIAKKDGINNVYWFPNHRKIIDLQNRPLKTKCRKGVFLGLVCEEKGVIDLCSAAEKAKMLYIDIYGRLGDDIPHDFFDNLHFCSYKGVIPQSDVMSLLNFYDVLFLPSYREGYPGAVIEAICSGLPVISSNLPGISEIVDEKMGFLVSPGDTNSLIEAINIIYKDDLLFNMFQHEVRKKSHMYSVKHWADIFIEVCNR